METRQVRAFKLQLPTPGSIDRTPAGPTFPTFEDTLEDTVPMPDPSVMLRQAAQAAPTRDEQCVAVANAWVNHAMDVLSKVGDSGRTFSTQDLEQINGAITHAAQHLQSLRHEAQTGTTPETRRYLDETIGQLESAYGIYAQIPFGQYRAKFFNTVYRTLTVIQAQNENLNAHTRNSGRVGGSTSNFTPPAQQNAPAAPAPAPGMPMGPNMAGSMQSPGMSMPMPGMPMPVPYAGMPIPGMPYPFPQPGVPIAGMPPLMPMMHLTGMPPAYPGTTYPTASQFPHPSSTPIPVAIPGVSSQRLAA